jgi:tetratricopeptide (TPR) repeat protein
MHDFNLLKYFLKKIHLLSYASILFLFSIIITGCFHAVYQNPNFAKYPLKTIAILPIDVQDDNRDENTNPREDLKELEKKISKMFIKFNYNVINPTIAELILNDNGIRAYELQYMEPSKICKILNVDCLIRHSVYQYEDKGPSKEMKIRAGLYSANNDTLWLNAYSGETTSWGLSELIHPKMDEYLLYLYAELPLGLGEGLEIQSNYIPTKIVSVPNQKYLDFISECNLAIENTPDPYKWFYSRAKAYQNHNSYDKAYADYTKAIEMDPVSAKYYAGRADLLFIIGKYNEALLDYSKVLELNPPVNKAKTGRKIKGWGGYEFINNSQCKKRIDSGNVDLDVLTLMGYIDYEGNKFSEALEYFEQAKKYNTDPKNWKPDLGFALTYFEQDEKQKASEYFDNIKTIEPLFLEGTEGIKKLEKKGELFTEKEKKTLGRLFLLRK